MVRAIALSALVLCALVSSLDAQPAPRRFKDAQLTVADGPEKTKQIDAIVDFSADAFQILTDKGRTVSKTFAYTTVSGAEYSYSKSPRWKSGLLISPFLFFSSGKKHWLLVKAGQDYALLRLEKGNYKLILAELETRSGVKVEAQGENK